MKSGGPYRRQLEPDRGLAQGDPGFSESGLRSADAAPHRTASAQLWGSGQVKASDALGFLYRREEPFDPCDVRELPFERFDTRVLDRVAARWRVPQFLNCFVVS